MVQQTEIRLKKYPRGFHLITSEILSYLPELPERGLVHLFIQHTSAGLTINENYDPSVRFDFEQVFNEMVPENLPYLTHTLEGPDDMPAHIKTAIVGTDISIPVISKQLALGTWQGIYLCEFRDHGSSRRIIATIIS